MSSPQQNTNQAQAPTGTTPPPMDQPFYSQYNQSKVGNQYDSDHEWFSTGHLHQEQNRHSQYDSAYYLSHPELPPPGLGHHSNGHGRILNQQATSNNEANHQRPSSQYHMSTPRSQNLPPLLVSNSHSAKNRPRPRPRPLVRSPPNFELPDHFGNTLHHNQSTTPYQPPPDPRPLSPPLPTPVELVVKAQKKAVDLKMDRKPEVKAEKKKRQRALPKNDESDTGGSGNEVRPKKKGGRTKGALTYGDEECRELVERVGDMLPIGQKGWEAVVSAYNKWARKNGYPERERRPLADKFNSLVTIAKTKPTGDAERRQMYAEALMAEDSLNEKAAIGDPRRNQATAVLDRISSSLDPEILRRREDDRSSANFQLMMLQNMQTQLNMLTQENTEQRRRADRAETELQMLRIIYAIMIPIIILIIAIHDTTPHHKVITPTRNIHHVGVIPPCKIGRLLTFQSLGLIPNHPPLHLTFLLLLRCRYLLYSKPHIQGP
ncbi:hypothetical protein C8J55DRAFT_492369 [Lentinula edodes]|uniref:Uncharacterized protein n=1 Tax=Lentinula lateritia TaxID=40482 RepID=A0A9W9DFR0_9AGAR|nr:hypothetical protein C8J55DRAFT_492369 [Lentinula edodes]